MNHLEVTALLTEMETRMLSPDTESAALRLDLKRLILALREGLAGISASDAMTGKQRLVRVYQSLKGER